MLSVSLVVMQNWQPFTRLSVIDESKSEMAETFNKAMVYALGCIGKADLTLNEEQRMAVRHILNGEDTFVWLQTGFMKSICYECLPFVFDFTLGHIQSTDLKSLVIVILPVRSLMVDQVVSLRKQVLQQLFSVASRA